MKKRNKLLILMGILLITFLNFSALSSFNNISNETLISTFSIMSANASPEKSDDGSEVRLKTVGCRCPNGDKGNTLRCKSNGDKEKCTPTQQGSNACYNMFGKLLCEGAGIIFN